MTDPADRHTTEDRRAAWADAEASRRSTELDREEALRLLGSVSLGRIVFTQDALPAIRPVNHLLHHGEVVIRTHEGAALATALTGRPDGGGIVVAYEADAIDPATHCGWSVVVTGYCHLVTDPDDLAHYQALLHPWTDHRMEYALRIRPDLVTGLRLSRRAGTGGAV
ncbi:pyridoxamine 5'-phosphate oxidase family protein [Streptomyces sp. GS7]|uniref:pyridoxamine 5'-phosphate oxidase family protein n=1 Tax=Streptomyces sp. GS7 TaxID=2692234 RepID=UPI001316E630|nr:pyridoxamine 5'-phosphate oxidase family protein [Streptomyces sp. GS7]QHC22689.1 pyridoxamine 5'-phosphate oxidase family protein [Streptomyces sp. GS7]